MFSTGAEITASASFNFFSFYIFSIIQVPFLPSVCKINITGPTLPFYNLDLWEDHLRYSGYIIKSFVEGLNFGGKKMGGLGKYCVEIKSQ